MINTWFDLDVNRYINLWQELYSSIDYQYIKITDKSR